MAIGDPPLRESFRPRGAHVILVEHVEHRAARETGIRGRRDERDREPWQDQEARPLQRTVAERDVRPRWEELETGHVELEEQEEQQQLAQQEGGHGVEAERDGANRAVGARAPPGRGNYPRRDADDEPQHAAAQRERRGDREVAGQDVGHGFLRQERLAQVAVDQPLEIVRVLQVHRLVEAQPGAHDHQRLLTGALAGDESRHIARHREVDHEHGGGHEPHHECAPCHAPDQEADHGAASRDGDSSVLAALWSRRGSSASRTLSPSRLKATVVTISAEPGKNTSHHATL